jgi:hypothetical protein
MGRKVWPSLRAARKTNPWRLKKWSPINRWLIMVYRYTSTWRAIWDIFGATLSTYYIYNTYIYMCMCISIPHFQPLRSPSCGKTKVTGQILYFEASAGRPSCGDQVILMCGPSV